MAQYTVAEDSAVLLELPDSEFKGSIEFRGLGISDMESQPGHLCFDIRQHLGNVATRVAR